MLSLQGVKGLKVITRTSSAMYKINVIKKLFVFFWLKLEKFRSSFLLKLLSHNTERQVVIVYMKL